MANQFEDYRNAVLHLSLLSTFCTFVFFTIGVVSSLLASTMISLLASGTGWHGVAVESVTSTTFEDSVVCGSTSAPKFWMEIFYK